MQLTIKLEFSPTESTEMLVAISPEDVAGSLEDFIGLAQHALALIHHNAQAYRYLQSEGTLRVMPSEPNVDFQFRRHRLEMFQQFFD